MWVHLSTYCMYRAWALTAVVSGFGMPHAKAWACRMPKRGHDDVWEFMKWGNMHCQERICHGNHHNSKCVGAKHRQPVQSFT